MAIIPADRSVLVIVDVQERLVPVVRDSERLAERCHFLLDVAQVFRVPAVLTEQYPKGLGTTVPQLAGHSGVTGRREKLQFSACAALQASPLATDRDAPILVLAGIETHICVQQTALDLLAAGCEVVIVADACSSRFQTDHDMALERLRQHGAIVTTSESLAFEWCRVAGTDEFKALSKLVRARPSP